MKRTLFFIIGALATTLGFAAPSHAIFAFSPFGSQQLILNGGAITLNASNTGWYDQTGFHNSANAGYVAGVCGDNCGNSLDYHDFFVFNLANVTANITSAQLSIGNPSNGYVSLNPTEPYSVWDVSTPIATLIASQTGRVDIFNDLYTGAFYAGRTVSASDDGTQVLITLNAAAIAALQGARGGSFAFGGGVGVGPGTPEPGSMILLGTGLLGLAALGRGFSLSRTSQPPQQISTAGS